LDAGLPRDLRPNVVKAMAIRTKIKFLFISVYLFAPILVFAQAATGGPQNPDTTSSPAEIFNPLEKVPGFGGDGVSNVPELISWFVALLVGFVGLMSVIAIVVSGYQMVFGGGNPETIQSAKSRMTWAIIGIFVVVLAYTIVRVLLKVITGTQGIQIQT